VGTAEAVPMIRRQRSVGAITTVVHVLVIGLLVVVVVVVKVWWALATVDVTRPDLVPALVHVVRRHDDVGLGELRWWGWWLRSGSGIAVGRLVKRCVTFGTR